MAINSLWGEAISVSAPYFAALQQAYQAATKAAGPAANGNYVANSLSEGPNGDSLYYPNYKVARSIQMNIGFQREVWKGAILSADYIRNVGEHFQQAIDVNHVGDAQFLNTTAAQNAIAATTTGFDCAGGYTSAAIDCAIAAGATITDFASKVGATSKLCGPPALPVVRIRSVRGGTGQTSPVFRVLFSRIAPCGSQS